MYHFGLRIMERDNGFFLTRENYCIVNRKTSLTSLEDFLFENKNYEMMPKKWVLWYFEHLLAYLNGLPKYKLKLYILEKIELLEHEIKRYQELDDDYHLSIIKKSWEQDPKGLNLEDYTRKKLTDIKSFVDTFDLDFDITGNYYKTSWCDDLYKDIMLNFEFNLAYLNELSNLSFKRGVTKFKKNNPDFFETSDLNFYNKKSGYFILIIDHYKQLYVGKATDLTTRIRQHWNARKDFDRMIYPFGAVMTSKISIDSFRALDTTRILLYPTDDLSVDEEFYINQFDKKYVLNRIKGGRINVYSSLI
jgi:hypothetical protein